MIAWTLVYIFGSCGFILTPCLIKFYRKNLRLEKENNDLMDLIISSEVRYLNTKDKLEKVMNDYDKVKAKLDENTTIIVEPC